MKTTVNADTRVERMLRAAKSNKVSGYMRLGLYEELLQQGLNSPTLVPHMISDLVSSLPDGQEVINLAAGGQLERRCPGVAASRAKWALDAGFTQSGGKGFKEFRRLIAKKLSIENGIEVDEDKGVQPSIGSQLSLFGVIHILVRPGDDVLLMDPEYAALEPIIRMVGGNPVAVPLMEGDTEWQFDLAELEKRITKQTRMLFMSNGNNPTGLLYTKDELSAIADLAQQHDFYVLSDEEYEKIVFDGEHRSIGSLSGMEDRTITVFSYSKAYSMSGMRIGYMAAPPWIVDYMQDVIRLTVQSIPSVSQLAAQALLEEDHSSWLEATLGELRHKRDLGVQMLREIPEITCTTPQGCYFLFPNIEKLGLSSFDFACRLLREEGVKVLPGMMFGQKGEGHVRVSGCVGEEAIVEGLIRMKRFVVNMLESRSAPR